MENVPMQPAPPQDDATRVVKRPVCEVTQTAPYLYLQPDEKPKLPCALCHIDMANVPVASTVSLVELAPLAGSAAEAFRNMRFCSVECAANAPFKFPIGGMHLSVAIFRRVQKRTQLQLQRRDLFALRHGLVLSAPEITEAQSEEAPTRKARIPE
jgi:hypothetical protein